MKTKYLVTALAMSFGLLTLTATTAFAGQGERAAIRLGETDAGNLVADSVRALAQTEIAFVPASVFKLGSKASNADAALKLVEPGSDALVILKLKGSQIRSALERSVSFAGTPFSGFLQVSGLKFQYNPKAEIDARVLKIEINGVIIDPNKIYSVATTKPLADGQQGYFQVWTKDQASLINKSLADALAAYPKTELAKIEGRITSTEK
jgi:2',3'-cyclic-nucleotide 2'-phosphodiesterase (5'-nucleotidase family)